MRILVISNLYPPKSIGGYEERCAAVVSGLRARGHEVRVLTSHYGQEAADSDFDGGGICRGLVPVGFFGFDWVRAPALLQVERHNQQLLRRLAARFQPDVMHVFNLGGIGKSLLAVAARLAPLAVDVSDHWMIRGMRSDPYSLWRGRHPLLDHVIGAGLTPMEWPAAARPYFCSAALRTQTALAGFPVETAPVIHCGIDTSVFDHAVIRQVHTPLRCLYIGRLHADKGVHTAIAAMAGLVGKATLDVYGAGEPAYTSRLHIDALGLPVHFRGRVEPAEVPAIYPQADVLIFPSEWQEPFALTPLEAAAAGRVIVGTTTGGSGEFLDDGVNALTYPAGDAGLLARALLRLVDEPGLAHALARNAQLQARQHFGSARMLDAIEGHLRATAGASVRLRRVA